MGWLWITFLFSVIFVIVELPALVKKKQYKEIKAFLALTFIATILCVALSLNVKLPNPFDLITYIYKPMSDMIFHLLE